MLNLIKIYLFFVQSCFIQLNYLIELILIDGLC